MEEKVVYDVKGINKYGLRYDAYLFLSEVIGNSTGSYRKLVGVT